MKGAKEYLESRGWRVVSESPHLNHWGAVHERRWSHEMVLRSKNGVGLTTKEAYDLQKRHEKEGRVVGRLGGFPVVCCGEPMTGDALRDYKSLGFSRRSNQEPLICELWEGHPDVHVASARGKERGYTDEWTWETDVVELVKRGLGAPEKEQGMASAYEATVQIYKTEHGVTLITDATTLDSFHASIAKLAKTEETLTEADWGRLLPEINKVENTLNNFTSKGAEQRRLLIAGQSMPAPIDMVFSTGPGLPSVELSPNGEAASV